MTKKNLKSILANGKNKLARKIGFGFLLTAPFLLATSCKDNTGCDDPQNPDCENYDPCYGVQGTYNIKKSNEIIAANDVRTTFGEIAATPFGSGWNNAINMKIRERLEQTGAEIATIKDTAIVSEERCRVYLEQYANNEGFMQEVAPSMRRNLAADSTYIVTEQDLVNYYNQHQACITR